MSACGRTVETRAASAPAEDVPAVAVAKAVNRDLSRSLVLTAEFVPFQEVDVMAKVAGYVKEINVDVGDHVRQGQILATLEIPELQDELTKAKANVDQASAEVARARDEISRAESVHQMAHLSHQRLTEVNQRRPGLVAQQDIDDAHSKDLVSEAQVAGARSALAAAQLRVSVNQAEQARVKTLLGYTRVTAPFTGVITKRFANTGSMIQAGTASQTQAMPVVRLSQNELLRLILPVMVHVPTLNRSFPGRVARFAERLQLATRTMETEVDVPNPSLVLIPGMYAEVNLTTATRNQALTVPVPAVDVGSDAGDTRQDSGTVMVLTGDNRIEVRPVKLGLQTSDAFEILSGLSPGDQVVLSNRSSLHAGQHVQPKVTALAAAQP
jgi:RND family efflux transporter MFP subunit